MFLDQLHWTFRKFAAAKIITNKTSVFLQTKRDNNVRNTARYRLNPYQVEKKR